MSPVGQREIVTQRRVVTFFQNALDYDYLGDWKDRPDNSNVEQDTLRNWLRRNGHDDRIIARALDRLRKAARWAAARPSTTRTAKSTACSATE